MQTTWIASVVRLFRRPEGTLHLPLVLLFLLLNGLVLTNAILHDPEVQYDPQSHLAYARALADGHLPDRRETSQYYVPPLPYVLPALLMRYGGVSLWWAAKGAQFLNVGLSVGVTLMLLALCERVRPGRPRVKMAALLLLALLPAYYRTMAFMRGEPFVAFFGLLAVLLALRVFGAAPGSWRATLGLGAVLGLLGLSRQLGLFIVIAVAAYAVLLMLRRLLPVRAALPRLVVAVGLYFALSGWFYQGLKRQYGSAMQFNRDKPTLATVLSRDKLPVFFDLRPDHFFTCPLRPRLGFRALPVLYSDLWGDYALYFLVYGRDTAKERWVQGFKLLRALDAQPRSPTFATNYEAMGRYIGHSNRIGFLPVGLWLIGLAAAAWPCLRLLRGRATDAATRLLTLLFLYAGAMLAGFAAFLVVYAFDDGFFKASYLLQLYPVLALLGAVWLDDRADRWPRLVSGLLAACTVVLCVNLPLCVTRYARWPMRPPADAFSGYTGSHRPAAPARP